MSAQREIGIIGAGNAAEGIIQGILRNSVIVNGHIVACDLPETLPKPLSRHADITMTADNRGDVEYAVARQACPGAGRMKVESGEPQHRSPEGHFAPRHHPARCGYRY